MRPDEFAANFVALIEHGLTEAVIVTEAGRDKFVLISIEEYTSLTGEAGHPEAEAAQEVDLDSVEWNR